MKTVLDQERRAAAKRGEKVLLLNPGDDFAGTKWYDLTLFKNHTFFEVTFFKNHTFLKSHFSRHFSNCSLCLGINIIKERQLLIF